MSLSSNKSSFENDLKKMITKAAKEAFIESDKVNVSEADHAGDLSTRVANKFSEVFAKSLAPELAKSIQEYIESADVNHKLTAPNGKVSGTITLT